MIFKECPQFNVCSCNVCPLDPRHGELEALAGEETCGARRSTRKAIAAKYPDLLPGGGLTHAEVAKDKRIAAGRAAFAALPLDHPRKLAFARNAGRLGAEKGATRGTPPEHHETNSSAKSTIKSQGLAVDVAAGTNPATSKEPTP